MQVLVKVKILLVGRVQSHLKVYSLGDSTEIFVSCDSVKVAADANNFF